MNPRLAAIVDYCWPWWAQEFEIGYRAFLAPNIYRETGWLAAQILKEWHGSGVYGPNGIDLGTVTSASAREELAHFNALRQLSEAMDAAPPDYQPGPAARALTAFRNALWESELTRHSVAMSEGGGLGMFHGALAAIRRAAASRRNDALVTACLAPIIIDEAGHLGGAIKRYLDCAMKADEAAIVMDRLGECLSHKVAERREQFAANLAQPEIAQLSDEIYQAELARYRDEISAFAGIGLNALGTVPKCRAQSLGTVPGSQRGGRFMDLLANCFAASPYISQSRLNRGTPHHMSLLYDEAQQAIASESARALEARTKVAEQLALLETQGAYDEAFWAMAKEQGWTGIALPETAGGLGLSLIELGLVAKACGAVISGAPFLTSSYGAARGILDHGSADLKAAWLERLASGDAIGVVAFGEGQAPVPTVGGVTFEGGKLNGTKPAVSGGAHADVALVLAYAGGAPVMVTAALAGVERNAFNTFDNSRCTADLVFADTPAEIMLPGPKALDAALHILALQSVVTAHEQTGGAEAMMLRARDYANTRRAFGQLIGGFQSVKHRIAELYGLVELARANALHAAAREGHPDFLKAAAAARLSATEAYDTAARDCVQVHGGIGVTWEAGIHLHLRRTRTLAIEQGNGLFWEDVLVNQLVGDGA